jgi:hypothetical protein
VIRPLIKRSRASRAILFKRFFSVDFFICLHLQASVMICASKLSPMAVLNGLKHT